MAFSIPSTASLASDADVASVVIDDAGALCVGLKALMASAVPVNTLFTALPAQCF